MEALSAVLNRFMRLLPFLSAAKSYRHFPYELVYPYPGIRHARILPRPLGDHVRPYLEQIEMNDSRSHRGEPFC